MLIKLLATILINNTLPHIFFSGILAAMRGAFVFRE